MSWFGGSDPFEGLVERATSEFLPQGQEDLAVNLEICDLVRSRQVAPKDASRVLRKRIGHKNPNVQLLALKLTDTVVKNGGQHFLTQVASREFMEDFVSIIRQPATNSEVKAKALAYLKSWASAFQGKPELSLVGEHVRNLSADGFAFPESSQTSTYMVDAAAPPDWTDSDVCMRCRCTFTMTNRKHHCRNCGQTFCAACSSKTMPLPRMGINQAVRICDGCYASDTGKTTAPFSSLRGAASASSLAGGGRSAAKADQPLEDEDDDLRRAIEASLKDSEKGKANPGGDGGGPGRPGYMPSPQRESSDRVTKGSSVRVEEDDADLDAAIAASLSEVNITHEERRSESTELLPSEPAKTTNFSGLTDIEKEKIADFAELVNRIHEMGGDILANPQIQALYAQVGALQPMLIRTLEDAIAKHQVYYALHERISCAVKIYDKLLEERLNASSYRNRLVEVAPHVSYTPAGSDASPAAHDASVPQRAYQQRDAAGVTAPYAYGSAPQYEVCAPHGHPAGFSYQGKYFGQEEQQPQQRLENSAAGQQYAQCAHGHYHLGQPQPSSSQGSYVAVSAPPVGAGGQNAAYAQQYWCPSAPRQNNQVVSGIPQQQLTRSSPYLCDAAPPSHQHYGPYGQPQVQGLLAQPEPSKEEAPLIEF